MNTDHGTDAFQGYRLRSARTRKRTAKEDQEKYLRKLYTLEGEIREQLWNLPWVPLAHPYISGWHRLYVLRPDVQRSKHAAFFETLLSKINHVQFSRDKDFRTKKRYRRKYRRVPVLQPLKEIDEFEWNSSKCRLTQKEKQFFFPKYSWCKCSKRYITKYVFSEPWRFVLVVRPRMITKVKMTDATLESSRQLLENHIRSHHLKYKMIRLVQGYKQSSTWGKRPRVSDPFKNKSLSDKLHAYLNEE